MLFMLLSLDIKPKLYVELFKYYIKITTEYIYKKKPNLRRDKYWLY